VNGARVSRAGEAALVTALLAAALALQVRFLHLYRHSGPAGDARAYYEVGQALQRAFGQARQGAPASEAFAPVRPLLYFAGVGSLYGALDALWPGDWHAFRVAFAVTNTLGMLGCFLLARALTGSRLAAVAALALAVVHPSFHVQGAKLLPDPVTGALFVWSAWAYARGAGSGRRRWLAAAGLLLGTGLLVRSQLLVYVLAVMALVAALSAPRWARARDGRRAVGALTLGLLPTVVLWAAVVRGTGGDLTAIEQLGPFGFRWKYPYGFWQFMDSDGWMGPYRLKTEPYYGALAAEGQRSPGLLRSRPRQLAFTARYVLARPVDSVTSVLNNVYRTYDRPPNDYQRDYPLPYPWQLALHRAIIVSGLLGLALVGAERPALAGAFLVPATIAAVHGVSYPWPRFAQPALLVWIAFAGAGLQRIVARARRAAPASWAPGASLAVVAVAAWGAGRLLGPPAARVLDGTALLAVLAVPFAVAWPVPGRRTERTALLTAWGVLAVVCLGHLARDRTWHERGVWIRGGRGALEQEILLSPEAVVRLREASEAFLVVDLLPANEPAIREIRVQVNGRAHAGAELVSTLPRLAEATDAGWKPRWAYAQWWALPLDRSLLPAEGAGVLTVRLEAGAPVRVATDNSPDRQSWYDGPSFGDWPHLAEAKLEYDGDHRLPWRARLGSEGTRSALRLPSGERKPLAGTWRVRAVTLDRNLGYLRWQTDAAKVSVPVAYGFFAYNGARGRAALWAGGRPLLELPLGASTPFTAEGAGHRLCHVPQGVRGERPYGAFVLLGPGTGAPLDLELRFLTGMSVEPMYFVLDRKRRLDELVPHLEACAGVRGRTLVNGIGRLLDASANEYPKRGRWTVREVF
jgi:4-amino-4-deoxy-L-arabinose transferase-like glycosyltransferase